MNRKTLMAGLLCTTPFCAFAVEPAPAETIQPNPCKAPDLTAIGAGLTKEQADTINANNKAYQDCVQNYVNQQQALGNAHFDAAKRAADEFKAYFKALNEKLEAVSGGKSKDGQ